MALHFTLFYILLLHFVVAQKAVTEESSNHVAVHLAKELPKEAVDAIARRHGFINRGNVAGMKDIYLFEKAGAHSWHASQAGLIVDGNGRSFPHLSTASEIQWFEQQKPRLRVKRSLQLNDRLYNLQWHLHGSTSININVEAVWKRGITGSGVTIGIIDDGVDYRHPDLKNNYSGRGSYDFNGEDSDPLPYEWDVHGTAAAGVAAAESNDWCGVGAAPDATLSGIRLIASPCTDIQEANALCFGDRGINDIYSSSWGPTDDGLTFAGPDYVTRMAIEKGVREGRDGKGSIFVWASGNGRGNGDSCAYDGYANSMYTISVAAIDGSGRQPFYSEGCASLLVSAPSSGSGQYIVTTGAMKADSPSCYKKFGGTSAACPIVAGVIALMLQTNAELGWRDVQAILAKTARPTDITGGAWTINSAGYRHSHKYGFGLVDADAAVTEAQHWKPTAPSTFTNFGSPTIFIGKHLMRDEEAHSFTYTESRSLNLQHVIINVDIENAFNRLGSLSLYITSPSGITSTLIEPKNRLRADPPPDWQFTSVKYWGENCVGTWTLKLSLAPYGSVWNYQPFLQSWSIQFYGKI